MNKADLFAKMKYRLDAAYPQYKFTIIKNDLVMIYRKKLGNR